MALFSFINAQTSDKFGGKEVSFETADNILVTGDLYALKDKSAPLILLFHQAGYSRGEYRSIAPQLNKLGFQCLAIDQRSGNKVNDVINKTKIEAKKQDKRTKYPDAFPDLEAALKYASEQLDQKKVIIWGSSYSSSLVFILASKYPEKVQAILSFSPGEYFSFEDQKIEDFSKKVSCPVFITSARLEKSSWKNIYENVSSEKAFYLPEKKGFHGSKALWPEKEGNKGYWNAVKKYLTQFKK